MAVVIIAGHLCLSYIIPSTPVIKDVGIVNIISNAPSVESGLPHPSGRKMKLHTTITKPATPSKVADILPYFIRINPY